MQKTLILVHTVASIFTLNLNRCQMDPIHTRDAFEALKWVLLKLMYYALYLNVPSRTIELGFSWEINAFDICTVRFSQKPFRRNSIYCSFHLHQKACSPFLQCIYALRVYLCTIWKLKRCSSSKRTWQRTRWKNVVE